jgi:hypothetical protein
MNKIITHILLSLCTEKGYASLFKASVFLIGCCLIAISQAGSLLYDKDLNAHKLRFSIEATLNQPLEKIDCAVLQQPQRAECMVAKHEISTLDSAIGLLDSVVRAILLLSLLTGALSLIGFFIAPFYSAEPPKQL